VSSDWTSFLAAVAAPDQPVATLAALQVRFRSVVDARLFTVMVYEQKTGMARRIHTSHPQEYPVSGTKPLSRGKWSDAIVGGRRCFVANTIEAISEVFPDHELIKSLGCESVVNLPVLFAGEVIGTVNLLDRRDYYLPERVARIESLAPFATVALLATRCTDQAAAASGA
jgi:hypothetical protein